MRRPPVPGLVFCVLLVFCILLAFHAPILQSQTLNLGPPVPLPPMGFDFTEPSVLALDDGQFVVMSRYATSYRTSSAPFAAISSTGDELLSSWEIPMSYHGSFITLSNAGEDFVYFSVRGLFPFPGQLAIRTMDSFSSNVDTEHFPISPQAHGVGGYHHATRLTDGRYVATWTAVDPFASDPEVFGGFAQVVLADGTLQGELLGVTPAAMARPNVAPLPGGGFIVAWLTDEDEPKLLARAFDALGNSGPIQEMVGSEDRPFRFDLAGGEHGAVMAWRSRDNGQIWLQRLDNLGNPLASSFLITDAGGPPQAAMDAFGRTWVTWVGFSGVALRVLGVNGSLSPTLDIPPRAEGATQRSPHITVNRDGRAMVAWEEGFNFALESTLEARTVTIDASCMEDDTMLCLHQGRFQVEVEWTDHAGDIGRGRVVPFQSSDSGLFWFFDEANWEVMVKVINGCDFNGFYWIFSAATTDVAYDLKVTDTVTGLNQIYSNSLGEPAPANTDTMALMSCDHGPP